MYYVVKYSGPFGFIKPYSAQRDELIHTQQFLSPGTITGICKKIFGPNSEEKIVRHKLNYDSLSKQQENIRSVEMSISKEKKDGYKGYRKINTTGIVTRLVMVNPVVYLAFENENDAHIASKTSICLIRNEDILLPDFNGILKIGKDDFSKLHGFELLYDVNNPTKKEEGSLPVGKSKFIENIPMCYGVIDINLSS